MKEQGTTLHTVSAYAPISNGRAERMVETIMEALGRVMNECQQEWDEAVESVLFGYRSRPALNGQISFELYYGVKPRIVPSEVTDLVRSRDDNVR